MISEPMVRLAQTVDLSCTDTNTVSKEKEVRSHMGSGASKTISEPTVRSTQTVHLSCFKISTMSEKDGNELPLEPHHLVVPSNASKTISDPMVCPAQAMHLSCTDTNTVSKRKEERFHMTHVT